MPTTKEARPAVFIGLGGAGTNVIVHLKRNFIDHLSSENPEFQKLQFIALDTSRPDYEKIQQEFGRDFLRENEEWFSIGGFNPYREYSVYKEVTKTGRTNPSYESLKQWLDERAASRFFDRVIEDGASADRQQGRLCFWRNRSEFEQKLGEKIKNAYDLVSAQITGADQTVPQLEVYIVSSTCGGTGSSIFLDVCYAVNRIYQTPPVNAPGEPEVRAVLFLPFRYIAIQEKLNAPDFVIDRYKANGYGFFEELEYLFWDRYLRDPAEQRGRAMHRICVNSEEAAIQQLSFTFRPFQMAFLADDKTDQNETIRDRDLYPNTARALFNLFISSATSYIDSAYDNIEQALQALDPSKLKYGTVPAYATFGYRSIEYPKEYLLQYFQERFAYEALEFGLLRKSQVKQDDMKNHVVDVAQRLVYNFLFQLGADPTVANFEKSVWNLCGSLPEEVDLADFYQEKDEEKGPKLDTKKVTVERLKNAVELSKAKADYGKQLVKSEYNRLAQGDDISKGLTRVKLGLQNLIDGQAPLLGLRYARDLLYELDVALTAKYLELEKRLSGEGGKATEVIKTLESAQNQIEDVADKPKRKFEDFKKQLQSYVYLTIEQSLLEHQLMFLKDVSKEETIETPQGRRVETQPLVDRAIRQVDRIIQFLHDDLLREANEAYKRTLPKEFEAKNQDVMTEYIPNLKSLLEEGSFADKIYRQIVQSEDMENFCILLKEALQHEDKGAGIEGLSFFLSELYDQEKGGKESAQGEELLQRLRKFANEKFRLYPTISQELRKPLLEVIEGLSKEEVERIQRNFRATRTLCLVDTVRLDNQVQYYAYAFANENLGRKLGLSSEDINNRWVQDDDPTRIVAITVKTLLNKEGIAGLNTLEPIYEHRNRQANLPHIKKEWNDFGPQQAERADTKANVLVLGLAFDYVVQKLKQKNHRAIPEILSDENRRTNQLQDHSPIFIQENKRGGYEIIGCVPEKDSQGRMMLKQNRNITLSPTLDYTTAHTAVALRPELESAVEEFTELFEEKVEPELLKEYLDEYFEALEGKFKQMSDDDSPKGTIAKMLDMLEVYKKHIISESGVREEITGPVV